MKAAVQIKVRDFFILLWLCNGWLASLHFTTALIPIFE
jgi:hypothetical protein